MSNRVNQLNEAELDPEHRFHGQAVLSYFCSAVQKFRDHSQEIADILLRYQDHEPGCLLFGIEEVIARASLTVCVKTARPRLEAMLLGKGVLINLNDRGDPGSNLVFTNWPTQGGLPVDERIVEGQVVQFCLYQGGMLLSTADSLRYVQVSDDNNEPLARLDILTD